jgi:demethylmenaquinone methyltransferase/2-methoxy-6-polyprenyl-1,4-benzoquinol methylase
VADATGSTATTERVVIDASRPMLHQAVRRGSVGIQGDAGRFPVRSERFDAVVVLDALHHLPDRAAALAEASRVLRPGGVLVVREFDPETVRGRALVAAERVVGFDSVFRGPDETARAVGDAGLDPTVLDRGFAYTVVGTKRGSH